jgi:hypothetical protein
MAQDLIYNDLHVFGNLSAKTMTLPPNSVVDASISSGTIIDPGKVGHQFGESVAQEPGTAIVAQTKDLGIVNGQTGGVVSFKASITGAIATGADRTVTVDLQKSTAEGAFASILAATIQFTNADTLRAKKTTTFSDADLVTGDILRVVITVAGAAGAQAQGLIVTVYVQEDPA